MKLTKTRIIKKAWGILLYLFTFLPLSAQYQTYPQQMERLDRGVVALPAQDKGIFVSWRLLGTDAKGTTFDLLRDGKTIAKGLSVTNYVDKEGSSTSRYSVITKLRDNVISTSSEMTPWADLYRSIPLDRPEGRTTPDGRPYQYRPNDCSVGDVDGDGQYELFLKWDPSNAHDNAHDGYTGDVIIDCYKINFSFSHSLNSSISQRLCPDVPSVADTSDTGHLKVKR